jgi:DNA (cytosine-5)-methyltransferase 1
MSFIDLFCGTGAFSYVLEKKGLKCVFANDIINDSKEIYKLNMNDNIFKLEDLHNIDINDIPKHDILCGGFPCQPFSIAGKRKGFNDKRSNVFWKIIEILNIHKPKIIILENVKNLTSHDKAKTFNTIKSELEKKGYKIKYKVLDTCKLSIIPQHRERIYIIGFLEDNEFDKFEFDFKDIKNYNIETLLEKKIDNKYYYTNKLKVYDEIKKNVTKHINTNTIYQYRRYYIRENKSNCCPTLTANMGSGGHNVPIIKDNKGIRKLTPRECFNLQGFPKDYKLPKLSDSKLYKLAGNAVSIPIIELIINKLIN